LVLKLIISPTCTVIIPCRNGAKYIGNALNSLLIQTIKPDEIIVIDDNSTDNSLSIVNKFPLSITLLRGHGLGAANARNIGIMKAKSEYIAFLDCDDIFHPEKIEIQLNDLQSRASNAMSFCAVTYIDSNGCRLGIDIHCPEFNRDHFFTLMLERNRIATTSAAMVKKSVLESVNGFDPTLSYNEEYDLWLRISSIGLVSYVDNVLLSYRLHEENISKNREGQRVNEQKALLKYPIHTVKQSVYRTYDQTDKANASYALILIRMGFEKEAERILLRAINESESDFLAFFLLANIHLNNCRIDASIPLYEKCIELREDLAEAYNNLGVSMARKGNIEKALKLFELSIKKKKNYSDPHRNILNLQKRKTHLLNWTRQPLREHLKPDS
jgi:glycosyltransferase involved in cell wall biosynthesis